MNKNEIIISTLVIVLLIASVVYILASSGKKSDSDSSNYDSNINSSQSTLDNTSNSSTLSSSESLIIKDEKVGSGEETKVGDTISVHYVGAFTDGVKFESSRDRNEPFEFTLGAGQVILGWDKGLVGMKVGGVRKLTIPSDLAYGSSGQGSIPPNTTLVFEIELLDIVK